MMATKRDLLTYHSHGAFLGLADIATWQTVTNAEVVARLIELAAEYRERYREIEQEEAA